MIGRLYNYFGVVGVASIAAWGVALALLVIFAFHRRRNRFYWLAVGLAIVGLWLAGVNSQRVSAIQVDRTEELRAARQRQERARALENGHEGPRFAEDAAPTDDSSPPAEAAPAYRLGGKQKRDNGKGGEPAAASTGEASATAAPAPTPPRMMKEADVVEANRLDSYNLAIARGLVLLALFMVALDYLLRFNRTFDGDFPLPIGGRWTDLFSRKAHSVLIANSHGHSWKKFLERFTRRGETFIYFGADDPWPSTSMPRLALAGKAITSLPRMIYDGGDTSGEFVFDSAWFGRYGVVVNNPEIAAQLMEELTPYLRIRHMTHASARHTVNVVWNLPSPPPDDAVRELLQLSRETNFRVVVGCSTPPPPELASQFEEVRS